MAVAGVGIPHPPSLNRTCSIWGEGSFIRDSPLMKSLYISLSLERIFSEYLVFNVFFEISRILALRNHAGVLDIH